MSKKLQFPEGFLWGTGTSAFQVEGNIENNWSEWMEANAKRLARDAKSKYGNLASWEWIGEAASDPENYIHGNAAEFEARYESDLDIAKDLGHNAHRFSIEWAKIEPKEGEYNEEAIQHYKNITRAIKARGMEPMITLWWWTDPLWITEKGGWENRETVEAFLRYIEKIALEFKEEGVVLWQPLNEPGVPVGMGYVKGLHPPAEKSLWKANVVFKNLMGAFIRSRKIIQTHVPNAQVGISHYARYMMPYENRWWNKLVVYVLDYIRNWRFLNTLRDHLDFIGIQYYRTNQIRLSFFKKGYLGFIDEIDDFTDVTDMGWSMYPKGVYHILKRVAKYKKDIYITENGIADAKDQYRENWIQNNLYYIHKAMEEGAPIKGYFHWSLVDIYEWDKGYWPRFGLVEVDFKTQKRTIRPSAYVYAEICKNNTLEIEE